MNNQQYKDKIQQIYIEEGQQSALQWAARQKRTKWEYCEGCECETATLTNAHECLICGQKTKEIKEESDSSY